MGTGLVLVHATFYLSLAGPGPWNWVDGNLVPWVISWVMLVSFLLPRIEAYLLHGGYRLSQLKR